MSLKMTRRVRQDHHGDRRERQRIHERGKSCDEGARPGAERRPSAPTRTGGDGKAPCLRRLLSCRNRIASWPSGCMRSSKPAHQPFAETLGTGCRLCQGGKIVSFSKARRSSTRATPRSASATRRILTKAALWPVAFALTRLTAVEEARIAALVKKAVS